MMKPNLKINIAGIELKNPVMTASGTFGSGREYGEFVDLNKLGAVVVKGVSSTAWKGNPTPRVAETYGGMLNSVGLQNPGVEEFIEKDIPFLRKYDTKIIVNIAGKTVEEYCAVAERLASEDVDMLELNISCPNVKEGGVCFGTDPQMAEYVTKEVKKYTKQPLIVKLTPNVTDVTEIARAAVAGGADALSLINTLTGMAIDIHKRKPILANVVGGLSGPAIKPVAVRMVYQVAQAVDIPIIGMGGIMTGEDAVEFLLAGATGVAIGTANFTNPMATIDVLEGIEAYLEQYGFESIEEIRGKLNVGI
ncbi:dihydroorotate dehydrogenase PyrD [Clostridium aceticum]|uniref:Dihydroorotate dehydrogenase n=1 Tax=Clostridium aceticum TaxID=84022 RepID=A0A0D8IC53_9CLOT|nr:dihydroorotate dehydrogenase [Clostridium aceticum]AKL96791.1 dihydroorotate dehydrogenase PyrD [Clostridium aceticum]KJF27547.1 dihydroorotate dehydrogenase [Clostridium aceticum]